MNEEIVGLTDEGRTTLLKDLKRGVVEIHFTKADGTPRKMRATLAPQMLPPNHNINEEKEFHAKNQDVIAVWDIEKSGWRSFRINTVEYVQFVDNY